MFNETDKVNTSTITTTTTTTTEQKLNTMPPIYEDIEEAKKPRKKLQKTKQDSNVCTLDLLNS